MKINNSIKKSRFVKCVYCRQKIKAKTIKAQELNNNELMIDEIIIFFLFYKNFINKIILLNQS